MKSNRSLFTIFLIVFIDLLGFGLILPLLPFIAERYQANPFQIGLLTATYSLFQFISAPILGRLSDRYGRKKILIISQLGSAIGYLLLGLANNLPLLFLSRLIDGITGGNISIAQAYIADVTDQKDRAKGMGLIGAAFGLGFIFGPAIGGLLSKFGFIYPALFATIVSLITVITTALTLKETVNIKKSVHSPKTKFSLSQIKKVLNMPKVGFFIMVFLMINLAFSLFQGNFALWAEKTYGIGPSANGIIFSFMGILMVIIQLRLLGYLVKKFGENQLLKFGSFSLSIGMIILLIVKHPWGIYLSILFIALGNGLANPSLQALASENVPREEYGETLGLLQSAGSLGRIIGPIIGGELFFIFGKDIPFLLSAIIILSLSALITLKI